MNQVTYRPQKRTSSIELTPTTFFWSIAAAIMLLIYVPFFLGEYQLRQGQISRGLEPFGSLPVLGIDSYEYATLASHLANFGVFSLDSVAPFNPETFRTVGYPAFVSLYIKRGLPLVAFPLVQMVLTVLTAYAVFLLGKNFWKPSVGIFSGVLYLLDPITIVNTLTIQTDILYVFLLVYSVYFFFSLKIDVRWAWTLGGLALGLSTLVRPISMFLLFVFILAYLLKTYIDKRALRTVVAPVLLCLVVYAAVVLPWVIRNKAATGVAGISTVKSYNVYHYYVPEFLAYKKGISASEARLEVGQGLGVFDERSLANSAKMEQRSREIIFQNPFSYGVFHLIKTIPFFISSGVETLFTNYNEATGEEVLPTIKENLTGLLLKGKLSEVFRIVGKNPVVGGEQVILLGLWLLALLSLYVGYKRQDLFKVILLWVIILYFAVLTGPVAYSRYRLPATPFLFMLATYAIVIRSYAPPHNHPETR